MRTKNTTLLTSYLVQIRPGIVNWPSVISRTGHLLYAAIRLASSNILQMMVLVSCLPLVQDLIDDFLEYSTSINRVSTPRGKAFTPAKVIFVTKLAY